jgi:hypothetical protein
MTSARTAMQMVCSLPTKVGLLADIAEELRLAGVNILAISAYERDDGAKFLMVTSDNARAIEALGGLGAYIHEKSVVIADMPNTTGALEVAVRKIADAGINIEYTYGTAGAADMATVVFKTADDERVASLLS